MTTKAAEKKMSKAEKRERDTLERKLIRKSMTKWEAIDQAGRYLGRGLGKKGLLARVAQEVGTTLRQVHSTLGLK